jgi:pimeloyl-ACP methyl ester carboxylesterase
MTTALATHTTERIIATADGVRLAVRDYHPHHAATTVVLLHGFCLTQASWSLQVEYLTKRWGPQVRILTYDHRGHGDSTSAATSTYRIEQLGADLAEVLAAADITTPLILAGHSMGGMAALAYMARAAARRPIDPAGLVLVATAAGRLCERGLGRMLATPFTNTLCHLAARSPNQLLRMLASPVCATASRYANVVGDERTALTALTARAVTGTPLSTAVGYLPGLRRYDAYQALKTITAHTVVVSGGADPLTPPAHAYELVNAIAGAHHIHLPRAGHMLPSAAPWAVNEALGRVLHLASRRPVGA